MTVYEPPLFDDLPEPSVDNKFHRGNGDDGKHYWLSPPAYLDDVRRRFGNFFDPCPYPKPDDFDGLTCEWGAVNYVNPPFGSIIHEGKGPRHRSSYRGIYAAC